MRKPRNPFRMRASEQGEDDTFVRLFSPHVLDILEDSAESLWDRPRIFRSAPGGGKTSLLRLFTPNSLLDVHAFQDRSDDSKDLFQRLKRLGALDERGPKILGIFLSFTRSLATLDDLDIDPARKKRLLRSLLNARITLAALRGALVLRGLRYPETSDLKQLKILSSLDASSFVGLTLPCSGKELYDWACGVEQRVCEALDSFTTPTDASLPGHDSLIALDIIRPACILHNGQQVAEHVLLMLDNLHDLTETQRRFLLKELVDTRAPIGIWMAERLIALGVDELLSDGAILGRDHEGVINLEDFWRRRNKRFEGVVKNIADCRVRETADIENGSFDVCPQNAIDRSDWQDQFVKGTQVVAERVHARASQQQRYAEWITQRDQQEGTPRDVAIAWRTLEILIEREERRPQRQLTLPGFDSPLEANELKKVDKSGVREAAELFFCTDFNIPYYYGISRLASMASSNIEQFLWLASGLFEEALSAALLKQGKELPLKRQEEILKQAVKQRWTSLPQDVQYGHDVRNFLQAIGAFAKLETDRPTVPYPPGVTGIAISMDDRDKLQDPKQLDQNPGWAQLSRVIKTCVIYNLLEVTLDYQQGQKGGRRWMVLYLNRMLCVHFALPLGYGGWRQKTLKELVTWLQRGFKPPKKEPELW